MGYRRKARHAVAAFVILAATLVVHWGVLFPPDPFARYPWSSDAWGHLIKAEYLRDQIEQGYWYPDLFPHWYSGQQMLRYYAPLPYYALVGILTIAKDTFTAGNWFLFLAALGGGLSMLLYARRFGLAFATLGGVLLVLLPDNIRVAFAEGNLPRMLAASLLPAAFYFLLDLLTEERHRRLSFAGLAVLLSLIVLSHAMMGAIFGACMGLFAVVYWLTGRASAKRVGQALLGVLAGVLLSGWWLLPSLTGGITDLNTEAASEALASFPWKVSLNPTLRWSNKEAFYIGASVILILGLAPFYWRRLDAVAKTLVIVGFITLLISSTLLNDVYNALPLHQLFWPLRFMSFSGFILALATVALLSRIWSASGPRGQSAGRFLALGVAFAMLLDFWQSTPLVETRAPPADVLRAAQRLSESPGWRVATADLSQLGSSPSYLFSAVGGKEQVYGWAYQGAATAPLLAMVNQGIEKGYAAFAVDRLEKLGSDDIVVLNTLPQSAFKVSREFSSALPDAGYELKYEDGRLAVYHRDGAPRVYPMDTSIFAVGSGGQSLALLFPEIAAGSEVTLDHYDVDFLSQFDTLVLSGFDWEDRSRAEAMVRELAARGRRVIVDLTGTPIEVLSRIPRFLDVYGERIIAPDQPLLNGSGASRRLAPFDSQHQPWQAFVPQGLDSREITFEVSGVQGTALGSKRVGDARVTFIGLNLTFHAVLTGDPVAIEILERELGVQAHRRPTTFAIPMIGYAASQEGYGFSLDAPQPGYYLIPVAYHTGTAVYVDGQHTPSLAVDSLTLAKLPAGLHRVEVRSLRTPIYRLGGAATALGVLVVAAATLPGVIISRKRFTSLQKGHRALTQR
jgi:uncharacterized membrane protein